MWLYVVSSYPRLLAFDFVCGNADLTWLIYFCSQNL